MPDEQEKTAADTPASGPAQAQAGQGGLPPRDKAEWSYKRTFGINEEMKKVIGLTISATQSEVTALRRKLDKLTYGS